MTQRRGITLTELLVVMSMVAVILGLIAGTIQTLARAERAAEKYLAESGTVSQLSESFRRTAWAAVSAQSANENNIRFTLDEGRTVEIQADGSEVIKIERDNERLAHQERYVLAPRSATRFEIQTESGHTRVSMTILVRPTRQVEGRPNAFSTAAIVGRDRRFIAKDR